MANTSLFEGIIFYIQSTYKNGIKPHTQNANDPSGDLIRLVLLHGGTISPSPINPKVSHIILTCPPPHPKDIILNIKRGGCILTSAGKGYTDEWLDENGWATFRLVQQFGGMVVPSLSSGAEGKTGWSEEWDGRKVVLQKGWVKDCLEEGRVWGREDNWGGWRVRGRYVDEPNPSSSNIHRPFLLGPRPIGPNSDPIFAPGITPFRLDEMDDRHIRSSSSDEEFNPNLIELPVNRYSRYHDHMDDGAQLPQRLRAQPSSISILEGGIVREKDDDGSPPLLSHEDESLEVPPQDPRKLLRAYNRRDLPKQVQNLEPSSTPSSRGLPSLYRQAHACSTEHHQDQITTGEIPEIPSTFDSPTQEKVVKTLDMSVDVGDENDIDGYSDLDCLDSDVEERVDDQEEVVYEQEKRDESEVGDTVVRRRSFRLSEMKFKKNTPISPLSSTVDQDPNQDHQIPETSGATHSTASGIINTSSSSSATFTPDPVNRKRSSTFSDGRPLKANRKAAVVPKLSKPAVYDCMKVAAWEMVNHPDESRRALAGRLSDVFEGRCVSGWITILHGHRKEIEEMVDEMMGGGGAK
ncbi:hypothetical protein I302_108524 [Kwoniella bestiolae CBS 10118]|uniref:BRCT domain-containing protein n=1 Tax=Kwoniella bestiolae CBS 10118 TaxID=1296100 RepID=A0A1B9FVI1_9TREE|nr:hypothetical protein I302_07102 [Kwoniella bestiolae CBS 10118]OCF22761.1 hypothetical protein I302_07102 [Kwoniella bestiolae CBS 10118]